MNMPALPAISPSQPPVQEPAHSAEPGASSGTPRSFASTLSQQGPAAKNPGSAARPAIAGQPQEDKPRDPLDPDATLALILDSAALPLMQPVAANTPGATGGISADPTSTADPAAGDVPARATTTASMPSALLAAVSSALTGNTAGPDAESTDLHAQSAKSPVVLPLATTPAGDPPHKTASTLPPVAAAAASADRELPDLSNTLRTDPAQATVATALPTARTAEVPATLLHTIAASDAGDPPTDGFAAGASLLAPTGTLQQAAPVVTLAVPAPLGSPQWAQDMARQIVALTQSGPNGTHTVQLHVNPPELGPVHISLQIGDASTQATFMSPHAHVRQALENALPDLQQQFSQAGLSLGQANVSDQQAGQQGFAQSSSSPHSSGTPTFSLEASAAGSAAPITPSSAPSRHPDALVDTFV